MTNQTLSNIHPKAKIGKNVIIEPFATIYEDVVIGDNCWIASNVVIMNGARIGNNCKIFPGAIISAESQDLKYNGEYAITEIGDNTTIREYVTIHKGTLDKKTTKVGSNCLLMSYVHVAHDCTIGDNVVIANLVQLAGHVMIGDWVIIEGTAAIQQFVSVGQHAFIAGGSLVRKNVPPYVKAAREPLTFAGVNSIGLRRRGFSDETIRQIEDLYRILYIQNSNISKGIEAIKSQIPESGVREEILEFISTSDKGIIRGMI